jgi:hypothetical protein
MESMNSIRLCVSVERVLVIHNTPHPVPFSFVRLFTWKVAYGREKSRKRGPAKNPEHSGNVAGEIFQRPPGVRI